MVTVVPYTTPANQLAELRAKVEHFRNTTRYLMGRMDELNQKRRAFIRDKEEADRSIAGLDQLILNAQDTFRNERNLLDQAQAQLRNLERSGVVR